MIEYATPILSGALMLMVFWNVRKRQTDRVEQRMSHLRQSTELLRVHRMALAGVLDSHKVQNRLKHILIAHSDAMGDRQLVAKMAKQMTARPFSGVSSDVDGLLADLTGLAAADAELYSQFGTAIVCGTLAAVLRWPETAVHFEALSARLAANPKTEVPMAVTASSRWSGEKPFGGYGRSAAMA